MGFCKSVKKIDELARGLDPEKRCINSKRQACFDLYDKGVLPKDVQKQTDYDRGTLDDYYKEWIAEKREKNKRNFKRNLKF